MDGKSLKVQIKAPRDSSRMSIMPIDTPVFEVKPPINMPKGTDGKFRVVIDPGHGGSDAGAIRNGVYEKFITLDVAKRVEKMLKAQGYGVLMTRSDDSYVSLQDRVAFSEAYAPDIFVSIHVNSSTSDSPNGIETHYYHQESIPLAQTVHSSLISTIKANNRGTFKSKFYVINHTTSPAVLIEIGFLSNYTDRVQLLTNERKQATAKAIVEGINDYFKSSK
jgi:N-acetylmuramoyl-L-alanine amidase